MVVIGEKPVNSPQKGKVVIGEREARLATTHAVLRNAPYFGKWCRAQAH